MTFARRFTVSRKQIKYNIKPLSKLEYKSTSPELMLSELIKVETLNLNRLSNINMIYDLLIQIKNFKDFMIINDLNKDTFLNVLNTGTIKMFKLEEKVHKKGSYPQFYFLVLVGIVSYYNKSQFTPGSFFGDEIIREIPYKNTAFASEENTILLLIPKELFITTLKDNIINTNEKIEKLLIDSFHIFKTFDFNLFNKYKKKMIQLFPFTGQSIISNEEIANSIFIIFKGSCALNIEENKDLIILEEGDIFGIESLTNIDDERNIMKGKYLYNIINKSPNTIIFKFFIKDLNQIIINSLRNQLESYFSETKNIVQKRESMREDLLIKLMRKYRIFKKKKNMEKLFSKSNNKDSSPEKTENYYYKALDKIQIDQKKKINDKQKLIHKVKFLFNKKQNDKNNLFQKIIKSKSFLYSKENSINSNTRKKIMTNILLKKDIKEIKKIILKSDLKKMINNNNKSEEKKDIKKNSFISNKNKKNEKLLFFNNSSNTLNIQDNSKNNSFFYTSINYNKKRKDKQNIYKTICILSAKRRIKKYQKKLSRQIKEEDISKNKDEGAKTILASTYRDTISYRNKSHIISSKKQIEAYGCTALNTMDYFNYGEKEKSLNASNYECFRKKINYKKCIFYETNKYNIPLFILCDEKEKEKFPKLLNF